MYRRFRTNDFDVRVYPLSAKFDDRACPDLAEPSAFPRVPKIPPAEGLFSKPECGIVIVNKTCIARIAWYPEGVWRVLDASGWSLVLADDQFLATMIEDYKSDNLKPRIA